MGEEKSVLLTQEAFDTLKDELAHRQGQYREEITKRIAQPAPRAICRRMAVTRPRARSRRRTRAASTSSPSSCATPPSSKLPRPQGRQRVAGDAGVAGREMTYALGSRDIKVATKYDVISPSLPSAPPFWAPTREIR